MPVGWIEGIIFGEAQTNFGKKCHIFLEFYCLKSFHDPNLAEARASEFHRFRPPWLWLIFKGQILFSTFGISFRISINTNNFKINVFFKFLPFIFDDI